MEGEEEGERERSGCGRGRSRGGGGGWFTINLLTHSSQRIFIVHAECQGWLRHIIS